MSAWEVRERDERRVRMARLMARGVPARAVFEAFGDATRSDLDTARQMVRRGKVR